MMGSSESFDSTTVLGGNGGLNSPILMETSGWIRSRQLNTSLDRIRSTILVLVQAVTINTQSTSDPKAVEGAVIDGREGAAPMVAVSILAIERAVGSDKLLGAANARVAKIEVGDTVQIRGNVALLARPFRLQPKFQSVGIYGFK